jgi:hypothetical protein
MDPVSSSTIWVAQNAKLPSALQTLNFNKFSKKRRSFKRKLLKKQWKGQSLKTFTRVKGWKQKVIGFIMISKHLPCISCRITNVSNAKIRILEEWKIVSKGRMHITISRKRSWYAVNVHLLELEVVLNFARSMELISSNSNASSVAPSPSGSVGVIHISVSHVIRNSAVGIMYQGRPKISCQNVLGKPSVRWK